MLGSRISESDTPPRKRRRPALSCVECRRRKIKCDRNAPCTQCIQSRSTSCLYKDGLPRPSNRQPALPAPLDVSSTRSSAPQISDLGDGGLIGPFIPSESSNYQTQPTELSARIVPLFNELAQSSATTQSHSSATTLYSPRPDSTKEPEQNVQVLLERVKKLEDALNPVSPENLDPSFSLNGQSFGQTTRTPVPELRGSVSKTRLFGQSHWMSAFEHFKMISLFRNKSGSDSLNTDCPEIKTSEIKTLLEKCKTMARAAKAERPTTWNINPNFNDFVPSREISDQLVNLYLRTFESTYRVLHIPTFEREYTDYWNNPRNTSTDFLVKLLLVMAIGTMFYQEPDLLSLRTAARQWVAAAQNWMSGPFEKDRLNLSGLQVYCLVIIARHTTAVGGDLVWISVGSLVRMAITMGYHRDPKFFPKMTILHAELRRRLWATVLELVISSSFDSGNSPLISPGDWDTEPPSNINDNEIDEMTNETPVSKPGDVYTQNSLQLQLLKSLRTRLEISRLISDFRYQPSYDDILRLGTEITSFGLDGLLLGQNAPEGSLKPTTLHRNLLDTPIRRVLLALHFPFAMKTRDNPRFYFSRKVCLDNAITIITYPSTSSPTAPDSLSDGKHDDYTRLKLVDGGFFKETLLYAAIVVQLELITQLEEQSPLIRHELDRKAREPLRNFTDYMIEISAQRIVLGENNIKGHLFLSAVRAQVDAMERGEDPDPFIAKAAKDSATTCYGLLKSRVKKSPPSVDDDFDVVKEVNGRVLDGQNEGIELEFGSMEIDKDFAFEYLMADTSMNFDVQQGWLFEGWEELQEW